MRCSTLSNVLETGLTSWSTATLRLSKSFSACFCWELNEVLASWRNCSWFALRASEERALKVSPSFCWAVLKMRSFSRVAFSSEASLAWRLAVFCLSDASESLSRLSSSWLDDSCSLSSKVRVCSACSSAEILATRVLLEFEQASQVMSMAKVLTINMIM